jgi:hypothetical protein
MGEMRYGLTSVLDGIGHLHSYPRRKVLRTHRTRKLVVPKASMDAVERRNILLLLEIEPRCFGWPSHSLLTVATELSWLLCCSCYSYTIATRDLCLNMSSLSLLEEHRFTKKLAEAVMLLSCIRDVFGSNVGRDTDYLE